MFHACEKYDSGNNTFINITGIKSVQYHAQSGSDGVFQFGNSFASSIEVTYYIDTQADLNVGDIIRYSHVLDVDLQTFAVVPQWKHYINFFFVDSFEKNGNVAHFIAYDVIKKFDVDYSQRMLALKSSFPMTCQQIINDISSFVGYPIVFDTLSPSVRDALVNYFYVDGITARTILSNIAQLQGGNLFATYTSSSNISTIELYIASYRIDADAAVSPGSKATGYYVIAPTDQQTYIADGKTLIPLFYKQDGLEVSNDVADPIDCVKLLKYDGTVAASYGATENNVYAIRNNIIVENTNSTLSALGLYNLINSINGAPKIKAKLFPFRCAYGRAATRGITYFVDLDGTIKQIPIMNIDWTKDGVVIESYGVSTYQYSDYETQNIEEQNQITAGILNNLTEKVNNLDIIVGDGVLDSAFAASDLTGAVNEMIGDVKANKASIGATDYDDTDVYSVGDYVIYNRSLYRCNTTITTPEAWDGTKWDLVTLLDIKVDRTGDTMTGTLILKNTDYDQDDAPSPSSYRYITWTDMNDNVLGRARSVISSTETGLFVSGRRMVNGSAVENAFGLYVDGSGNQRVAMTSASKNAWKDVLGINATEIAANTNLNNIYEDGYYKCTSTANAGTLSNVPSVGSAFSMIVISVSTSATPSTSTAKIQAIFNGQYIWVRRRTSSSWGSWYRFTGTAV